MVIILVLVMWKTAKVVKNSVEGSNANEDSNDNEDSNAKIEDVDNKKVSILQGLIGEYSRKFSEVRDKMPYIEKAVKISEQPLEDISKMVWGINKSIKEISEKFYGDGVKSRLDIQSYLTPSSRLGAVAYYQKYSIEQIF